VITLGERRDMEALMASVDVFCLSSHRGEAFPNVLGEAMSCEVVPVTTDVGDAARIVGETGYVVPRNDVGAMARTLEDVLSQPEADRVQLARSARERVSQCFDLDAVASAYGALYQQLGRASGEDSE
jgi:glycosyltransferase involved in cell wall biosynthesis